jgi:CheY-like chemotaxis protein
MSTPPIPTVLRGRRVLVIDDDDDSRELLAELLAEAGAEVRTASDADTALAELAAFAPHVLVCDVSMPGEDGYALMRRIRALPQDRGGSVRAATFTAYARAEDRARAVSAGFDLHLTKPADAVALTKALASLADRGSPAT